MILGEEHFAAMEINWDEKSDNIERIAKTLNIGVDSMVFIDDSPLEREKMRAAHPEVLVPEFSLAPEEYVPALLSLKVFHQMSLTDEDRAKGSMYAQERARVAVQRSAVSKSEYIASLGLQIQIFEAEENNIPRVAQLTQKTNQYNLTTKRYSEADIHYFIRAGWGVYSAEVSDKFGGYGVVIVALIEITGKVARLDTLLMSCRVMGRDVEFSFLRELISRLREAGIETLKGSFVPTAKNTPIQDFLPSAGFQKVAGAHEFELDIRDAREALTKPLDASTMEVL